MSQHTNTITLNGKVYDSVTGRLIDSVRSHRSVKAIPVNPDISAPATPKSKKSNVHHPIHNAHRPIQHSKTLMRRAVQKPGRSTATAQAVKGQPAAKHQIDGVHLGSLIHDSAGRAKRAAAIPKSQLISRFSRDEDIKPTLVKKTAVLPVKDVPAHLEHRSSHTHVPAKAAASADELFSLALGRATGHLETSPHAAKRGAGKRVRSAARKANLAVAVVAVTVLAGFIAYQNMAAVNVRLAAQKAGVHASLPGYRPSGFALSRTVQSYPGEVILSFRSTTDSRNFTITQASSNWDSDTLLNAYVSTSNQHYQKVNDSNGQTVYLYGDANATWVNGGVWYRVQGNSKLTSSQLLNIVNSF